MSGDPGLEFEEEWVQLRIEYREHTQTLLQRLMELVQCLPSSTSPKAEYQEIHRSVHKIAGTAGSLDFHELGTTARQIEHFLEPFVAEAAELDPQLLLQTRDWILRLGAVFEKESRALEPIQARPAVERAQPVVQLLVFDAMRAREISRTLAEAGYAVVAASRASELRAVFLESAPSALIAEAESPEGELGGAKAVAALWLELKRALPVVFLARSASVSTRLACIRAGGRSLLETPVKPEALLEALGECFLDPKLDPVRVLLLDADEALSRQYTAILEKAGIQTRIERSPEQSLAQAHLFRPDLILVNQELPGCQGLELGQVLRQERSLLAIPMLLVSSNAGLSAHLAALEAGFDDLLVKPVLPRLLVSCVQARARRGRALRSSRP